MYHGIRDITKLDNFTPPLPLRSELNNSIQFFIISVLFQQPGGQLQKQHRKEQKIINTKNVTIIKLSRTYMTSRKVNTQNATSKQQRKLLQNTLQ
jgi:hypothetical protein